MRPSKHIVKKKTKEAKMLFFFRLSFKVFCISFFAFRLMKKKKPSKNHKVFFTFHPNHKLLKARSRAWEEVGHRQRFNKIFLPQGLILIFSSFSPLIFERNVLIKFFCKRYLLILNPLPSSFFF